MPFLFALGSVCLKNMDAVLFSFFSICLPFFSLLIPSACLFLLKISLGLQKMWTLATSVFLRLSRPPFPGLNISVGLLLRRYIVCRVAKLYRMSLFSISSTTREHFLLSWDHCFGANIPGSGWRCLVGSHRVMLKCSWHISRGRITFLISSLRQVCLALSAPVKHQFTAEA